MPNADITSALAALRARQPGYRKYWRYYRGDQDLAFATSKFKNAFGDLFAAFADNLCAVPIDAVADRLTITGFTVEDGDSSAADDAWAIWTANRMDQRAGQVHQEALRAGDAYLIVWPDGEGQPRLYPNRADQIVVAYDPEKPDTITSAAKAWSLIDGTIRLNLYYPDRTEKYVTRTSMRGDLPETDSGFTEYAVPGEPWPLPNEWGTVPVFHFANNSGFGETGTSELASIIPLQDALNKAIADMLVAMEYVALPQRWITGIEPHIDPATGEQTSPFTAGADKLWFTTEPNAAFGQFQAADLKQFIDVQEMFRAEIARISGIPLHYFMLTSGTFPSGEALKVAEARLVNKIIDRQLSFGNRWEDAMRLALRMTGQADAQLSTQWQSAAPRSETEEMNVALAKKQVGFPLQQILRELGYSEDQVVRIMAEADQQAGNVGAALLRTFNAGQG